VDLLGARLAQGACALVDGRAGRVDVVDEHRSRRARDAGPEPHGALRIVQSGDPLEAHLCRRLVPLQAVPNRE
jgi:hypothetical protein